MGKVPEVRIGGRVLEPAQFESVQEPTREEYRASRARNTPLHEQAPDIRAGHHQRGCPRRSGQQGSILGVRLK